MGERKFLMRELWKGEDTTTIFWVAESELKRRLANVIEKYLNKKIEVRSEDIDALFHGEVEFYKNPE